MKNFIFLLTVCIFLLCPRAAQAAAYQGPHVFVRVEGSEHTLALGNANGYTFLEAIEQLAAENDLTLSFVQSGPDSRIVSVATDVPGQGEWLGYVNRNGQILREDAYLDIPLQAGDEAVLYQGSREDTLILTGIICKPAPEGLYFFASVNTADWAETDGEWIPQITVLPVKDAQVYIRLPGAGVQTVRTGEDGNAFLPILQPTINVVYYHVEGYRPGDTPFIVRTREALAIYGLAADNAVTRAEAVAFLLTCYDLRTSRFNDDTLASAEADPVYTDDHVGIALQPEAIEQNETDKEYSGPFTDVDENTAWAEEILLAEAGGLVEGYGDGTFRPNIPITLTEVCVLVTRIFPELLYDAETFELGSPTEPIPDWAILHVESLYRAGLLDGIGERWASPVTAAALLQLYVNLARQV